jgi:hypothetical protein
VGGTHDRHAYVRTDTNCDHVLRDLLAYSYTRVIALRDDVGQRIVDGDLDLDVGIGRKEFGQFRPEHGVGRIVDRCDPDRASRFVAELTEGREFRLDLLEPWSDGVKQAFASLRRGDAAGGAGQQTKTETFLELPDGVAQRRLGHAEFCGCPGEAALARDRYESQQVIEVPARHS